MIEKNDIIEKTYELRKVIKNNQIVKNTKELEKKMLEDEKVIKLIMKFQTAQEDYNNALRFNDTNIGLYSKKLANIKEELYEFPSVIEYLISYKKSQKYLKDITNELFSNLVEELEINNNLWEKFI
ncbi:MAG: YlbF family regulator [Erysipelotrichales bacterium]|nr:YlbF family regulator [Erysipelotrichales bacterium]